MNIKLNILGLGLIGWLNVANAVEIGDKISNSYRTKISGNIATIVYQDENPAKYYDIDIYAVSTKILDHPKNMLEAFNPTVTMIEKKLWTITGNQLPITEDDCMLSNIDTCDKNNFYCYKPCFVNSYPQVIAIDDKNKKVYMNYASDIVGTGGGPSFLFVADINKREIKFLRIINIGEKGSISPSSRYLVIHGFSIIYIYDTEKKSWFEMNKSENDYYSNKDKYIIHELNILKWLSDTRFVYIDNARYFTRGSEPMPFISAKAITYDIATKTNLNEKLITEKEYDALMKKDQG